MEIIIKEKFILVKNATIWFAHIDKPDDSEFGRNKYQCTIFSTPKEVEELSKLCKFKLKEKNIPIKEKNYPLKSGDKKAQEKKFEAENSNKEYNGQHYEGKIYFKLSSNDKPNVVDLQKNHIDTSNFEFEGSEVNLTFVPWIYDKTQKGIMFILKSIQVINEGKSRVDDLDAFDYEDIENKEDDLPF